jgi:hypothetical protein
MATATQKSRADRPVARAAGSASPPMTFLMVEGASASIAGPARAGSTQALRRQGNPNRTLNSERED